MAVFEEVIDSALSHVVYFVRSTNMTRSFSLSNSLPRMVNVKSCPAVGSEGETVMEVTEPAYTLVVGCVERNMVIASQKNRLAIVTAVIVLGLVLCCGG